MQTFQILETEFPIIPLTDSHCHLSLMHIQDNESITEIQHSKLDITILDIATKPTDLEQRKSLFGSLSNIKFSVGCHPSNYYEYTSNELVDLLEPQIEYASAVGETGLDWYRMFSPVHTQQELFEVQILLAKKYNKPLIIHTRNSIDDALDLLKKANYTRTENKPIGVLHCFSGNYDQARRAIDMGLYLSFAAHISYSSAESIKAIIPQLPLDFIMLETDAPYILHRTVQKNFSKIKPTDNKTKRYSRVNSPLYLPFLYQTIAETCKTSILDIAILARNNYLNFIG